MAENIFVEKKFFSLQSTCLHLAQCIEKYINLDVFQITKRKKQKNISVKGKFLVSIGKLRTITIAA